MKGKTHDKPEKHRMREDHAHEEKWRVIGNNAQMIDVSEHGPLSLDTDSESAHSCANARSVGSEKGEAGERGSKCSSGASDGAASSRQSAARRAEDLRVGGFDIEGPAGVGGRIT